MLIYGNIQSYNNDNIESSLFRFFRLFGNINLLEIQSVASYCSCCWLCVESADLQSSTIGHVRLYYYYIIMHCWCVQMCVYSVYKYTVSKIPYTIFVQMVCKRYSGYYVQLYNNIGQYDWQRTQLLHCCVQLHGVVSHLGIHSQLRDLLIKVVEYVYKQHWKYTIIFRKYT